MSKSVFSKDISPACGHCIFGKTSEYSDEIFCLKHGVTERNDACRHYKYDVLKRTPNRIKPVSDFKPEDFEI